MKHNKIFIVILLLSISQIVHAVDGGVRDFPEDNFARSAIVYFGDTPAGSGFFVNGDSASYFVTARHVLFDPENQHMRRVDVARFRSPARDLSEDVPLEFTVDLELLQREDRVLFSDGKDIAVIPIGRHLEANSTDLADTGDGEQIKLAPGLKLISKPKSGMVGAPVHQLLPYSKVFRGNRAFIIGYPSSLRFLDMKEPVIASGVIAGFHSSRKLIILDIGSYPGFSGSPIIQSTQRDLLNRNYNIVGVLVGVNNFLPEPIEIHRKIGGGIGVKDISFDDAFTSITSVRIPSQFSIGEPIDNILQLINEYEDRLKKSHN